MLQHTSRSSRMATVSRVLPFAIFIGFLVVADGLTHITTSVHASTVAWLTVVRGLLVGLLLVAFWRHYRELRHPWDVSLATWLWALLTGLAVFAAWIALDHPWFRIGPATQGLVPLHTGGALDLPLVILRLMGLVIVVPVMEELFWRSFLLRWLTRPDFLGVQPRRVSPLAFVVTAALFASAHDLWLAGLVAGVAYNWLYVRTGTLWAPVAAHGVTNAALGGYVLWSRAWHLW